MTEAVLNVAFSDQSLGGMVGVSSL
jgi:hypothetical protein